MTLKSLLKTAINVNTVFIEKAEIKNGDLVIKVRQHKGETRRCPVCGKRCPRYDRGTGKSRWRALDIGLVRVFIECECCRVYCKKHKVVTERVIWARHGSAFTRDFEDTAAWLMLHGTKTVVSELMRVAYWTVGAIIKRVSDEKSPDKASRYNNLECIGIDETSYRKGHKYMTVIVNHANGRLVWAKAGYGKEVLEAFLQELTPEQRAKIKKVTADGAKWIADTVKEWCPNAERTIDPFHVVQWGTEALDEVRKIAYLDAEAEMKRQKKDDPDAKNPIGKAKYAVLKNPENLTEGQQAKLEFIAKCDKRLYRAYLLKEDLRLIFHLPFEQAGAELEKWLSWARRCRIPQFVKLYKKIKRHADAILATIKYGLSNSLIESMNNKIKLTIRMAYGFRNIDNMLALIMLRCSDIQLALPGRL
jgi:transposase